MGEDKIQFPVLLDPEDYEWLENESERSDDSKAGVVRRAIRLYRATGGLLGPSRLEMAGHVYANEQSGEESQDDEVYDSDRDVDSLSTDV